MKTLLVLVALTLAALCCSCAASSQSGATGITSDNLVGEWTVESVAGTPVAQESPAFLGFGDDQRLYGNSGVNRVTGSWSLEAETLEIGQLASTRMAGAPELMELESRLLAALAEVRRAELDEDGRLTLLSSEAAALVVASRRTP